METGREEKPTSENRIAESECGSSVFQVLTIQKQYTQTNSNTQLQTRYFHISSINSVFSGISGKVAPQLKQSVSLGQSPEVNRYYSERRPAHTDLNSRHQSPM